MQLFPDNTVARYNTKLSDRIHFDDQYEVALVELTYTNSFKNIRNDDGGLFIRISRDNTRLLEYKIEDGYYESERDFVESLNNQLLKAITDIRLGDIGLRNYGVLFRFDDHTRRLTLILHGEILFFTMSRSLTKILGFCRPGPFIPGTQVAVQPFDLNAGQRLMYVYCDIASYAHVGSTKSPLLRVCDTRGKYGEMVRTTFDRPFYMPVAKNDFETILIHITDELGRRMPFTFGKSVATLHFRRRHNLLAPSS
jgi:hypothetical protein